MLKEIGFLLILSTLGFAFEKNPVLAGMADKTSKQLQTSGNCCTSYEDGKILDFSGMVYDQHRHKVLAFGGGHATSVFPNAVVEFAFSALSWNRIIENVECGIAYTLDNALLNSKGEKLGGFNYNGKIHAGSRHTYDGLVMAADTRYITVAGLTEALDKQRIEYIDDRLFALEQEINKGEKEIALINRYVRQRQALIAKQY